MSYLAEEISRQITRRNLRQSDVASRSGISQGQISKWLNNEQTSISKQQLEALAPAISEDPHDHASLVRAHLLDEKFGPGADLVEISVNTLELRDQPQPRSKAERAIQFLSEERHRNRDLNDLLIDMARVLGADL